MTLALQTVQNRQFIAAEYGTLANKTTTVNTYADLDVWPAGHLKTKYMFFAATTNDLKVKILGSYDGGATYPITETAEFTLTAAAAATQKTVTNLYTHLKAQVKPAVNDTHGTLATSVHGFIY